MSKVKDHDIQYMAVMLGNPSYFKLLYEFARIEHDQGNLDFILAVREYKKDPNKRKAIAIIDKYVGQNPKKMEVINISLKDFNKFAEARQTYIDRRQKANGMNFLKRYWTSGDRKAAKDLFDDALHHVEFTIADTVARFFATTVGKAIEAKIQKDYERAQILMQNLTDLNMIS